MTQPLQIDFVSDVACPWCAVGLSALERALERLGDDVPVQLRFQPFELNPQMGAEGQDVGEHLAQKYGSTPEQQAKSREGIAERGAAVGVTFRKEGRGRIWNTFDAHRLLYWAGEQGAGKQRDLKTALLRAYHGEGRNPSDPAVLAEVAASVGLDRKQAEEILASDRYAQEVRDAEQHWHSLGISAVPSVVINNRHLIQGGQPPELFEQALRQLAQQPAGSATTEA
jgi:predicted DsbA family dithiol-disulfide isomerase